MKQIARLIAATALLTLSQSTKSQRLVEYQNVFKDITIRADVRNTRFLIPSPAGKLRKAGKPVAFFCGDSTMRNGSKGDGGIQGQWGWGLFAQEWFNADELVCENHGMGGMSSRTYYTSNLWQNVKNALKPGDYVIISFGHNDGGSNWDTKSSIGGTSATETRTVKKSDGTTETVYTFGQYLRFFIDETREKGATPILCSRTPRYGFTNGKHNIENNYRSWGKAIAQEKGVSYIDQEAMVSKHYNVFGEWKTYQLYCADQSLHPGLRGAWECAYGAALAIASDPENPLYEYLIDMTPAKLDIERTEGKPYTFTIGGTNQTSARDCYRSGDWYLVYNTIQPGDTVIMRFGQSELTSTQTGGELGSLQSADDKQSNLSMSATKRNEMVYSYGWYIHFFVNDCLERGAIPVLVNDKDWTPEVIKGWNQTLAKKFKIELLEPNKYKYNITVNCNGSQLATLVSGSIYEGETLTIPYPRYYNLNGHLYVTEPTDGKYQLQLSLHAPQDIALDYQDTNISDAILLSEAEDIKALQTVQNELCSSSAAAYAASDTKLLRLSSGTYTLTAAAIGGKMQFKAGQTEVLTTDASSSWNEQRSAAFTLTEPADLLFKGGTGEDSALDYFFLQSADGAVVIELTRWDFTQWSAETVANLKADAAASSTIGWSDVEKKADAEAGNPAPVATADKCFWLTDSEGGVLKANGVAVAELQGLTFGSKYGGNRSLAIAVNYPSTTLGTYNGPQYLWLGGGGKNMPCFVIHNVKGGSEIKMGIESHKPAEARGVRLYVKTDEVDANGDPAISGEPLKDIEGNDVALPNTYTEQAWYLPEDADIIVYNTSGCHLYFIECVQTSGPTTAIQTVKGEQKMQADAIFTLNGQRVEKPGKGLYIVGGKKVVFK